MLRNLVNTSLVYGFHMIPEFSGCTSRKVSKPGAMFAPVIFAAWEGQSSAPSQAKSLFARPHLNQWKLGAVVRACYPSYTGSVWEAWMWETVFKNT
jgi:hypothetical protein